MMASPNLFKEIATAQHRQEILDWYHLRENLYKVGGSLKRLTQAETLLWKGQVDAASALFADCRRKTTPKTFVPISTSIAVGLCVLRVFSGRTTVLDWLRSS